MCCFVRRGDGKRLLHWARSTKGNRRDPSLPHHHHHHRLPTLSCFLRERPLPRFEPFFGPSGHTGAFVQTGRGACLQRSEPSPLGGEADEVAFTRVGSSANTPPHPPPAPVPFPAPARQTQLRHRPPQLLVQHALLSRSFI